MFTRTGPLVSLDVAREHINRVRWYESLHRNVAVWPRVPVSDPDVAARSGLNDLAMYDWHTINPADFVGLYINVAPVSRSAWFGHIGAVDPCADGHVRTPV